MKDNPNTTLPALYAKVFSVLLTALFLFSCVAGEPPGSTY